MRKAHKIAVLATTLEDRYQGIGRFNDHLSKALMSILRETDSRVDFFPLLDEGNAYALNGNGPLFVVHPGNGNRLSYAARYLFRLVLERYDWVIVGHVNLAPLARIASRFPFDRKPRRWAVMAHGVEVWGELSGLRRRALQSADLVLSISLNTKKRIVQRHSVPSEKVFWLPHCVDPNWLKEADEAYQRFESPAESKNLFRVLTVARLDAGERYKGVDHTLQALSELNKKYSLDFHFDVVGEGTDLERHVSLARELGLESRVRFHGRINDAMLKELYSLCDCFVLPSEQEGFGIVYLEAMSYRKPIIAAQAGGAPEVVQDGETGFLVPYGNVKELAEKLRLLCSSPRLQHEMGTTGYDRLIENFTFDQFVDHLKTALGL